MPFYLRNPIKKENILNAESLVKYHYKSEWTLLLFQFICATSDQKLKKKIINRENQHKANNYNSNHKIED